MNVIDEEVLNSAEEIRKYLIDDNKEFYDEINYYSDNLSKTLAIFKDSLSNVVSSIDKNIFYETLNNLRNILIHNSKDYLEIYEKYLDKDNLNNKRIEYISLINKLFLDNSCVKNNNGEYEISTNLKLPEKVIPTYISYYFRENSNVSINDAYEKSYIKEINDLSKDIISNMKKVNLLSKEGVFKTNEDRIELAYNIRNIADNELGFNDLINYFYKGLFENSNKGNDNYIIKLLGGDADIIMIIKYYRNYYDHEIDNNKDRKIKAIIEYNKKSIGNSFPLKKSDWVKLQLSLYRNINSILIKVIEKLR